jgi:hypothetical protein
VTKFHALRVPAISVKDYLNRIFKYASCSYECFVLALIYIDRVIQRNSFVVNSLNVHRVVITSVMLAAKFFDDQVREMKAERRRGGDRPWRTDGGAGERGAGGRGGGLPCALDGQGV